MRKLSNREMRCQHFFALGGHFWSTKKRLGTATQAPLSVGAVSDFCSLLSVVFLQPVFNADNVSAARLRSNTHPQIIFLTKNLLQYRMRDELLETAFIPGGILCSSVFIVNRVLQAISSKSQFQFICEVI